MADTWGGSWGFSWKASWLRASQRAAGTGGRASSRRRYDPLKEHYYEARPQDFKTEADRLADLQLINAAQIEAQRQDEEDAILLLLLAA